MVAYLLHLHQIPFIVFDPALANTSSRVAAGMFTPISGKRKTIDPLVPGQISYAIKIYRAIEQLIGADFFHQRNVYHVYNKPSEQTDLVNKLVNPGFAQFVITDPVGMPYIRQELGACEITHSGWIDCETMVKGFARWLKQMDSYKEERFIYEDLKMGDTSMEYHGITCNNIIFCEGYRANQNPYFKAENIIPCKGDVLTIKYNQLATDRIIKRNGLYLLPLGNGIFKAGATYQWNNQDEQPDKAGKLLIESQLETLLENSFETVDHKAAIRPTTQNREVIAKQHAEHKGMYMLNGLGTRGILQGPWWARHIVKMCIG